MEEDKIGRARSIGEERNTYRVLVRKPERKKETTRKTQT
jgi:hypothetical protein